MLRLTLTPLHRNRWEFLPVTFCAADGRRSHHVDSVYGRQIPNRFLSRTQRNTAGEPVNKAKLDSNRDIGFVLFVPR